MESWLSPVCFLPAPGLKLQPELKRSGKNWLGQILTGWSYRDLVGLVGKSLEIFVQYLQHELEIECTQDWIWLGTPWIWLDLVI